MDWQTWAGILALVILVLIVATRAVVIVRQAEVAVVERLGRFHRVLPSGLSTIIPFTDRIRARVDLREQFITIPPQAVITQDNVTIAVDNVLYYQVMDPERAVYAVNNFQGAIENLVQTTLRAIIGDMSLDQTLSSRELINARLQEKLDRETNAWGVKVHRIEIKQIDPPREIKEAMEKQMRAERDKRAQITQAEAQKQAQILEAEGYRIATVTRAEAERDRAILEAEGRAQALLRLREAESRGMVILKQAEADQVVLALRGLETLAEASRGQATTVIIPTQLADWVGALSALKALWPHQTPSESAAPVDSPR
ncbi:MAG: SPFH/Band 7/PHB domain protein [Firmicutes bacterium]|nr:SPFH/Band 7/PHB domain protein [Bacillota bacterium]